MKYHRLTHDARIQIETLLKQGFKPIAISRIIGVHHSTVYREISRGLYTHLNSDYTTSRRYSATKGDNHAAFHRTTVGAQMKIGNDHAFVKFVEKMVLKHKYSPAAILMYMKKHRITFKTQVSRATLYNYIHKGIFLHVTDKNLPRKGKMRRKKKEQEKQRKKPLYGMSIEQRAAAVNKRRDFGHWELDTVVGKRSKGETLLVLTERKTRYELIYRGPDKTAQATEDFIKSLRASFGSAFSKVFKSITCDNGMEFSTLYKQDMPVYYCHPYSSWERGSNENQNAFIRRYIPKGTRIEEVTNEQIEQIQYHINTYPRALFDGNSAADELEKALVQEGLPPQIIAFVNDLLSFRKIT